MKLSCIRERNELMLSSSSPLNLNACANSLVPSNKHPQTYYLASECFFKLLFQDERRTEGEAVEKYLYLIYPIAVFPLWTTPKLLPSLAQKTPVFICEFEIPLRLLYTSQLNLKYLNSVKLNIKNEYFSKKNNKTIPLNPSL